MSDVLRDLEKNFEPKLLITVYKTKGDFDNYYLESHELTEEGKVSEGKPLQQQTIQGIVDVLYDQRRDSSQLGGSVPDNLLAYSPLPAGKYKIVWYRPAEIRVMHFATQLKLPTARAWVPPVLYSVENNNLTVFALKNGTRPKQETKLYRAPFHNVSDNGAVCLGSAKVKKPIDRTFTAAMKYWEDLFWLSEFTHLNGASNPTKTDFNKIWKRLLISKTKLKWSSLSSELKPAKRTIQTLIK